MRREREKVNNSRPTEQTHTHTHPIVVVAAEVDPAEKPTRVFMEWPSLLFTKGTDDRRKACQSLSAVGRDKLC